MTIQTRGRRLFERPYPPCQITRLVLVLFVLLLLSGCGVASQPRGPFPGRCDPATQWTIPSDNINLDDMALVGPAEAWAVGAIGGGRGHPPTGVIYHLAPGQSPAWQQLQQRFPGAELSAIAMDSPTDGWAASTTGLTGSEQTPLVLHYTGGSWQAVDIPALDAVLKGPPGTSGSGITWITVQMFGPDAGWMFAWTSAPRDWNHPDGRGRAVVILRYAHGAWTPIDAPSVALSTEMFFLSAVSADEAWIVGTDYGNDLTTLFAHYQHGAWSIAQRFPGVTERFTMLSPTAGWAFDNGTGTDTLLHYDGTRWSPVALPADWAAHNRHLASRVFAIRPGITWFVVADESARATLVPAWQIGQYADGEWQTVAMPFDDVVPVALAPTTDGGSDELWGVGNILHQEGCPPMMTTEVAQGVFLHVASGTWTRDVLP